jgi:hypothetical protein
MTKALPGWYADAQRGTGERWFDGDHWTDRRRDTPVTKSVTLRRLLIVLAVALGAGVVAAGALATMLG